MRRITIDPVTRLEGHGKVEIFLNGEGKVENAYFLVPELRGFEQFCEGRHAEEMPVITSRICGVCPEAHHLASIKALDDLFAVSPPEPAHKLRELLYTAFLVTDHATHFYALAGPDFIVGPDASPQERNILGVIRKVGADIGREVINCRSRNHQVIKILGGRTIHPVAGQPGGWSKPLSEENRQEIAKIAEQNLEFALFSLKIFDETVLQNPSYFSLITGEEYLQQTYYMGTVDDKNNLSFYQGMIRVVDPEGKEAFKYEPRHYREYISEHVEPWAYLKFPYLKKVGWKGIEEGKNSGVYCATPLSRLNAADSISTPRAREHFEKFFETLGNGKINGRYRPLHHRLATHWARLIELLYAAERMGELAVDPGITSPEVRTVPHSLKGEGIGSVEAPRGTLTHHYVTDKEGILKKVNLIVGTTNNHAPISLSVKKAAEKFIQEGEIEEEGALNRIEMAIRLYDPCLSCATHAMGEMPLRVNVRNRDGVIIRAMQRDY